MKKLAHNYNVKRKLQEQSGSYFVVLPKIWVKSMGLKQGDQMSVKFNGVERGLLKLCLVLRRLARDEPMPPEWSLPHRS